jgi:hypothetical protein
VEVFDPASTRVRYYVGIFVDRLRRIKCFSEWPVCWQIFELGTSGI